MVQRVKVKSLLTPESRYHRMCQEEAMLRHNRVQLDLQRYNYKNTCLLGFPILVLISLFVSSFIHPSICPIFKGCSSAKKCPAVF